MIFVRAHWAGRVGAALPSMGGGDRKDRRRGKPDGHRQPTGREGTAHNSRQPAWKGPATEGRQDDAEEGKPYRRAAQDEHLDKRGFGHEGLDR